MRKIFCLTYFILFAGSTHSQVLIALLFGDELNSGKLEFGLNAGPGFTNITNIGGSTRPGFNLGLFFNIRVSENFFFHPEVITKASLGSKDVPIYPTPDAGVNTLFANGSINRKESAISIPLLARYRIYKTIFAEAGPQVDWRLKMKDIFEAEASDGNEITYENNVTKEYTWLSMGLAGGLAWKFKDKPTSMSIAVRYYYGLTDIQKTVAGTQSHRGTFILAYIPIGANKSKKKKAAEGAVN